MPNQTAVKGTMLVVMERLVVLGSGSNLGIEFLPEKMLQILPDVNHADERTMEGAINALRSRMIVNALQSEGGN